ncbi:hypothetical protein F5Y00DRAFT_272549 [Daldinia vernicosa]|uniref:uncharacterized protein n=1 Tax=Daldinia vernicosa TaxID=114800 RepID=UPI002008E17C|nr:uncharacterized protein F5Y00DRAFT_272549 [Daldinia vernicosa]KAI0853003.1 hypothetical protein F5Y00DRAFT_272549 [Daldinia vernicosa]
MDGPTSRLPSSSVPTMHPAGRQIVRESYKSAPVTPNTTYIDPPRPAREGCEWVWFPAGYWAEREVAESPGKVMKHFKWRKRSGKSSSGWDTQDGLENSSGGLWDHIPRISQPIPSPLPSEDSHNQSFQGLSFTRHGASSESSKSMFPLNRTPQSPRPSPYLTEEAHVQSLQRSPQGFQGSEDAISFSGPARPIQSSPLTIISADSDSATPLATPASQLTSTPGASVSSILNLAATMPDAKPRKSFFSRLFPDRRPKIKKVYSDNDAHDYTANSVPDVQAQPLGHGQTHSPVPLMGRAASLLRKESKGRRSFKLFGKSPWHREAYAGSDVSASSSILDVLRGRTPVTSPVSYIEPTHTFCAEFPGGEATRIQTPPLRGSGYHACQPQSFFFDISTPTPRHETGRNSKSEPRPSRCPAPLSPPAPERNTGGSGKEWWEVPVALNRYETVTHGSFEFDMPEHLPNSPMCPTNKRHASGGTGICVYHGRRKKSRDMSGNARSDDDDDDDDGDRWI